MSKDINNYGSISLKDRIDGIVKYYGITSASTSKLCRKIVFASIAGIWVFFQKNGIYNFPIMPTKAIGLLCGYIIFDIAQYFLSTGSYFCLYVLKSKLGDRLSIWHKRVDYGLFCIFLTKILYLLIILVICTVYLWVSDIGFNIQSQPE